MKVTERDVAYVADLANLELSPHERHGMLRDLNSILDYIDILNELDTSSVAPMAQVLTYDQTGSERTASDQSTEAIREDIPEGLRPSLPHDLALANAPDTDGTFLRVPKVIER